MKRVLSMLLALMLCVSLAGPALAADVAYPLPGGDLHFDPDTGTVTGCYYLVTSADIPAAIDGVAVTSIGDSAFYLCWYVTRVTIPDGVKTIGIGAFDQCISMTSITIPASVTEIGNSAFWRCQSLTDVYYEAGPKEWEAIRIEPNNMELINATIHFGNATADRAVTVTVSGSPVVWTDATPFIDANGRTMVPLRAVADALGLDVRWDGANREAVFSDGDNAITFPIDSAVARTSAGGMVTMDTAAVIVNDRTYAPIRYLAEYFGYAVGWEGASKTVTIK